MKNLKIEENDEFKTSFGLTQPAGGIILLLETTKECSRLTCMEESTPS
jgi:hypothetical protein